MVPALVVRRDSELYTGRASYREDEEKKLLLELQHVEKFSPVQRRM